MIVPGPCGAGLAVLLALLVAAGTPPAAQFGVPRPEAPAAGSGAISGIVVDDAERPVPEAIVAISPRSAPVTAQFARRVTDARGRFVFTGLAASPGYFLSVDKFGYLGGGFGRQTVDDPPRRLALADGEWRSDVTLRLFRESAISGTVRDEVGEPVTGATVRVLSRFLLGGSPVFADGPAGSTDDRGVYRIAELVPGDYVVAVPSIKWAAPAGTSRLELSGLTAEGVARAEAAGREVTYRTEPAVPMAPGQWLFLGDFPVPPPAVDGQPRVYATTYFPSGRTPLDAALVTLRSGEERVGVDITFEPVPARTISGRVVGLPPGGPAGILRLLPAGAEWLGNGGEVATAMLGADGSFAFVGVPAGSYVILLTGSLSFFTASGGSVYTMPQPVGPPFTRSSMAAVPGAPRGTMLGTLARGSTPGFGRLSVEVGSDDLTGVQVNLERGVTMNGRLVAEGGPDQLPPTMSLSAEPATGNPALGRPGTMLGSDNPEKQFTLTGLMPGEYVIRLSGGPMLKSVTWNGREMRDTPFDAAAGRDFTNVVITTTARGGRLAGSVRGSENPDLPDAVVICFPVERERWSRYGTRSDRLRAVDVSTAGEFAIAALPAGDYFLIAVPGSQRHGWTDPVFLAAAAPLAQRTVVEWGSVVTEHLEVREVRRR